MGEAQEPLVSPEPVGGGRRGRWLHLVLVAALLVVVVGAFSSG